MVWNLCLPSTIWSGSCFLSVLLYMCCFQFILFLIFNRVSHQELPIIYSPLLIHPLLSALLVFIHQIFVNLQSLSVTALGTRDIDMNETEKKNPWFINLWLPAKRQKVLIIKILSLSNSECLKKKIFKNVVCFFVDHGIVNDIAVLN